MEVFVRGPDEVLHQLSCVKTVEDVKKAMLHLVGVPTASMLLRFATSILHDDSALLSRYNICHGDTVSMNFSIRGGIDFQNRAGSKPGTGGVASESQANIDRRERLRKLALETVDLAKDPYFMKNHLGTYECKLCLTLHNNEGNYLAHTQGKRHQTNLARRAAKEAANASGSVNLAELAAKKAAAEAARPRRLKIGLPGYKVTKQRDPDSGGRILLFQIMYPDHDPKLQPRHRFMSAFEQKIEAPNKKFQYLLFACEPYETIAFKIPNMSVDKSEGKLFSNWDKNGKTFTLQLCFSSEDNQNGICPSSTTSLYVVVNNYK
jgi:splicing factor 3A subunit 2